MYPTIKPGQAVSASSRRISTRTRQCKRCKHKQLESGSPREVARAVKHSVEGWFWETDEARRDLCISLGSTGSSYPREGRRHRVPLGSRAPGHCRAACDIPSRGDAEGIYVLRFQDILYPFKGSFFLFSGRLACAKRNIVIILQLPHTNLWAEKDALLIWKTAFGW